jgi:hypothetical protein
MNDPAATLRTNRVKSNKRRRDPQQASQSLAGAGSLAVEAYVIPGSKHKHGYRHERGQLQWAAYVIAAYCPQEFRAQSIDDKSKFTRKVMKLLEREPAYVARFPKRPDKDFRRTVMRAWKLARARNGMVAPKPAELSDAHFFRQMPTFLN